MPEAKAENTFLVGHEDLPLLAGLVQDPDSVLVFDTPRGRVIEAYAQTNTPASAVLRAYSDALPQLGWSKVGPGEFKRDGETLLFDVVPDKATTVIRIQVTAD